MRAHQVGGPAGRRAGRRSSPSDRRRAASPRPVAGAVHHDRPGEVVARRVADGADRVAERAHACRALVRRRRCGRCRSGRSPTSRRGRASACPRRTRRRVASASHRREHLLLGRLRARAARRARRAGRPEQDDDEDELEGRDRGRHERRRAPRESGPRGGSAPRPPRFVARGPRSCSRLTRSRSRGRTPPPRPRPSAANVTAPLRARGRSSVSEASARKSGKSASRKRGRLTSGKPSRRRRERDRERRGASRGRRPARAAATRPTSARRRRRAGRGARRSRAPTRSVVAWAGRRQVEQVARAAAGREHRVPEPAERPERRRRRGPSRPARS